MQDRLEYGCAGTMGQMKQHEHRCPDCGIVFVCRGKACENHPDRETLCELCWETFSD